MIPGARAGLCQASSLEITGTPRRQTARSGGSDICPHSAKQGALSSHRPEGKARLIVENLPPNDKSRRISAIQRLLIWCGEGDLNPYEIAPASTSTYSSHSIPHDCTHLRAIERCDRVGSSAVLGTNASQSRRLTNGRLPFLASIPLPLDAGFRAGRAAEKLGTLARHRAHPKVVEGRPSTQRGPM